MAEHDLATKHIDSAATPPTLVRKHKDSQGDVPSGIGRRHSAGSVGAIDEALSRRRAHTASGIPEAARPHRVRASNSGPDPYAPKSVEGPVPELRSEGVLGSSRRPGPMPRLR